MSGATPEFVALTVAAVRSENPELACVELAPLPAAFRAAHTQPGQYVQIAAGPGKPGFFALANAPGGERMELLVKRGNPVSDAICATAPGGTLQVSAPAGKGYPLHEARGHDLILAGVGSALAPLRAVLQQVLNERAAYGEVTLLYGVRDAAWLPFRAEFEAWRGAGVNVRCAYSEYRPDGSYTGERVQDALATACPHIQPDAALFACGMKAMVAEITAAAERLGLAPGRVFQNF